MRRMECGKGETLLGRCKDAVRRVEPEDEVIVYGSRARGDAAEDSDYDLLALVEGPVSMNREERVWKTVQF